VMSSARSALVSMFLSEAYCIDGRAVAPQPDRGGRPPIRSRARTGAGCARSGASRSGWRCRRRGRAGIARRHRPGRPGAVRERPGSPWRRRGRPQPSAPAGCRRAQGNDEG
jgi:hypothetical protein